MQARALTLIETLATVVILALATAVLARGLSSTSPERDASRAWAILAEFDAAARAMARTAGPLQVTAEADRIAAMTPDAKPLIVRQWPYGWSIAPAEWSQHDWLYIIDPAGRSDDVELLLIGPHTQQTVRIEGLLGNLRKTSLP